MRIGRLLCTSVHLPFPTPFVTAHGTLAARECLILRLETDDGATGWGEASAVPGFGSSHAEVEAAVRRIGAAILGQGPDETSDLLRTSARSRAGAVHDAAALFGLATALHDLCGQAAGRPLSALLAERPAQAVAVNATVSALGIADAVAAARQACADGFACIKLKAGVAASEAEEAARVAAVREAIGPAVALRIDANGAWQPAEAIRILSALESLRLEYVEQPVPAADLAGMARVRAAVRTPVAADESAGTLDDVQRVIEANAAEVIVLKPMLAGTLRDALAIAALARDAGLGVAVTSTLDSGVAVAAALQMAAGLGITRACGLATASLLESDLLDASLPVERGVMSIPQRPGLGVTVNPAALAYYAIGSWEMRA